MLSGSVDGINCMLLLSAKNVYNPIGNVLGNDVSWFKEQFKYDSVRGKFKDVKALFEQSIYDMDAGKLGNEVKKLLLQLRTVNDDDTKG